MDPQFCLFILTIVLSYYYRRARFWAPTNCISPTLLTAIVEMFSKNSSGSEFSAKYIVENYISSNHENNKSFRCIYGLQTLDEAFFSMISQTFGLGQTNWADKFWGIFGQTISTILAL